MVPIDQLIYRPIITTGCPGSGGLRYQPTSVTKCSPTTATVTNPSAQLVINIKVGAATATATATANNRRIKIWTDDMQCNCLSIRDMKMKETSLSKARFVDIIRSNSILHSISTLLS